MVTGTRYYVLLAWMPMLALTAKTRRWEPKRLRPRLFSAAAHIITTGRRWLRFTTLIRPASQDGRQKRKW